MFSNSFLFDNNTWCIIKSFLFHEQDLLYYTCVLQLDPEIKKLYTFHTTSFETVHSKLMHIKTLLKSIKKTYLKMIFSIPRTLSIKYKLNPLLYTQYTCMWHPQHAFDSEQTTCTCNNIYIRKGCNPVYTKKCKHVHLLLNEYIPNKDIIYRYFKQTSKHTYILKDIYDSNIHGSTMSSYCLDSCTPFFIVLYEYCHFLLRSINTTTLLHELSLLKPSKKKENLKKYKSLIHYIDTCIESLCLLSTDYNQTNNDSLYAIPHHDNISYLHLKEYCTHFCKLINYDNLFILNNII